MLALIGGVRVGSCGFLTPFFDGGTCSTPGPGALGRWALWWAWFVIWVLIASALLVAEERHLAKAASADASPVAPMTGTEGAL